MGHLRWGSPRQDRGFRRYHHEAASGPRPLTRPLAESRTCTAVGTPACFAADQQGVAFRGPVRYPTPAHHEIGLATTSSVRAASCKFSGPGTRGERVGVFLRVHRQKAEPVAHQAAYMAAVPFGCEAASPSCARSVQAPIVPSACGARRSNANPVCTRGAALVAVAPAARARSRGTEARVQEAHTRRKTERRSVRPRIRQRRSIDLAFRSSGQPEIS
jgi:hypothetical protein